ncbi:MAG: hypothetical protein EXS35_04600 [Pedosphaera sp.]|nr:hypothetical protein [Pedosphaera sp.]
MADVDTTGDKNFTHLVMKKNSLAIYRSCCLFLGALLATSVLAQTTTSPVPTSPPPKAAAKSAEKAAPKAAAKKSAPVEEFRTIPLVPGTASVIASNVNVRGKAGFVGEILFRVSKGASVTVIEEVKLKNSKEDEPSAWAKIGLPSGAHVWINSAFIDTTNKTVKPKKLNLRGGAGENYSIIGTLEKGAAVKEVQTKGDWMEIEAPPGAFAFVAAQYLKQEAPAIVSAPVPPEPAPTPTPVTEPAPVAPTTEPPAPIVPTPPSLTPDTLPPSDEPPPKRVIQHEGIVKGTWSIQAPTRFALVNQDTGKTINYLYTTSTNLDLSRYKGLHIVVTGEEGLDERWKNTPVITIQRILVLE